jgi:hypothetical protein
MHLLIPLLNFLFICFLCNTANTLSSYDTTVLTYSPVAYWPLDPSYPYDYSGHNLSGVFNNSPSATTVPNGDTVSVFNGIDQYFTTDDNNYLEIVRTGILTIEAWFRPDTLQFDYEEGTGYVWWMGKGYTNQQSWAARMYSLNNTEVPPRPNRISGYAFNLTGGLGAGSYFQDNVTIGQWIMYTLTINTVNVSGSYPTGYTKIFKNGIERDQDALLGYSVVPQNGVAPMRIGTRQLESFFKGAIGKVAVFDYELSSTQLQIHFNCMITNTNCTSVNASVSAQPLLSTTPITSVSTSISVQPSLSTMPITSVSTSVSAQPLLSTTPITSGSEKQRSAIWLWIIGTLCVKIFSWKSRADRIHSIHMPLY